MASTGQDELLLAVRELLITDGALAASGVYGGSAPPQAVLPYVVLAVVPGAVGHRLGAVTPFRLYRLQCHVYAQQAADAMPLKDTIFALFTTTNAQGDLVTTGDALNTFLVPQGFTALVPIEQGDIGPMKEEISGIERWHFGLMLDLRIRRN